MKEKKYKVDINPLIGIPMFMAFSGRGKKYTLSEIDAIKLAIEKNKDQIKHYKKLIIQNEHMLLSCTGTISHCKKAIPLVAKFNENIKQQLKDKKRS